MPENATPQTPIDEFFAKSRDTKDGTYNVKSEWSMAQKDMERIDEICKALDVLSYSVRLYRIGDLNRYHSLLYSLFMNLEPLMSTTECEELVGLFGVVKIEIYKLTMFAQRGRMVKPKMKLMDDLVLIHRKLYKMKQLKGLGMPVTKVLSEEQKLLRGFGIE